MRPLQFQCPEITNRYVDPGKQKNLNFHDGLLSLQLTSAGRPAPIGQIGRHSLAGISEGHRGK